MIREEVTSRVLELMNELLEADPEAVSQLVNLRVICNDKLADHSSAQVGFQDNEERIGGYEIGLLGILNGICGTYDTGPLVNYGPVTACYENGKITGFVETQNAFMASMLGEDK